MMSRHLFNRSSGDSVTSDEDWGEVKSKPVLWKLITSFLILVPVLYVFIFSEKIFGKNPNDISKNEGYTTCAEFEKTWRKCTEEEWEEERKQRKILK